MSDFSGATRTPDKVSNYRLITGILRIAAGIFVLAAITTDITDQVVHDAFVPAEFFSYVTIQSTMMNIVALIVGGIFALRSTHDTQLLTTVRMTLVSYAVIVGVVYNVLLRNIPVVGYVSEIKWPNEAFHVIAPIFLVLEFLLGQGSVRLGFRTLWVAVSYAIVWVAFTLVRGPLTGWYPYPFLEPDGPGGWPSVIMYVVGIAAFVLVVATGFIAITRSVRWQRLISSVTAAGTPGALA